VVSHIWIPIFHKYYGLKSFYENGALYPTSLQVKQNWPVGKVDIPALFSLERNWGTGSVIFGSESAFARLKSIDDYSINVYRSVNVETNQLHLVHLLFLREPVERAKSHWTHHEKTKKHNQGCSKFRGKFIKYFLACCSVPPPENLFCGCALDCRQFINFQTYMTSNKNISFNEPHIWNQEIPSVRGAGIIFAQQYKNLDYQSEAPKVLHESIENIYKAGFIGIVEHMILSICLFYDTFHFDREFTNLKCENPPIEANSMVKRLNFNKLSNAYNIGSDEEQLLKKINVVDTIIYDYAKNIFWKRFKFMLERRSILRSWSSYLDKIVLEGL